MSRVTRRMTDRPDATVIDASVAIAIIRREPMSSAVAQAMRRPEVAGGRILVPDPFWLEVTNVLMRRYRATPEEALEALREVDDLGVESVRVDRALLLAGIDLQHAYGLSAYDAAYLALAQVEGGQLLTLDARLAAAAGGRAIAVEGLPHRLSDEAASYGRGPVDWARFGPYIARLRAEARDAAAR
ncbi:MAG TPA: type II toxin-antitoxin system VapC family toxin [Candidatus Limnocylindrales bacterium]|nr:type II toxin-antitoxin system VapC family toxin [Candidatus Limnocylindrales bacterium]